MALDILRKKINHLDKKISALLEKRAEVVKKIGKEKKKLGIKIINPKRENKVLNNVSNGKRNKKFVKQCFRKIIKESRKLQK